MTHSCSSERKLLPFDVAKLIVASISEAKGKDVVVLNTEGVFSPASYFVIVSGRSDRQVQGISNRILATLENAGITPYSIDGLEGGHWVLLDFDEVIVHVFFEPVRDYYNLEALWAQARRLVVENDTVREQAAA